MIDSDNLTVWSLRLKAARDAVGLSQRLLGIAAGIDPSVASTRINRYETGVHAPTYSISCKLAEVLGVPVAYLYCDDDRLAEFILLFHQASNHKHQAALKALKPD